MFHLSAGRLHLGSARGNHYTFFSPLPFHNKKKKVIIIQTCTNCCFSVYLGFAFLGNPLPHAKVSQWVSSSFRIWLKLCQVHLLGLASASTFYSLSLSALHVGLIRFTEVNKHVVLVIQVEVLTVAAVDELLAVGWFILPSLLLPMTRTYMGDIPFLISF